MAFHPKDNPLRNVKVETRQTCGGRTHYSNLIIFGLCPKCRRTLGAVSEDGKVFARLEELKRAGV